MPIATSPPTACSMEFARAMLTEAGFAATPGRDFDPVDGGRYIALFLRRRPTGLARALERLEGWLKA